jgi:hypothetical protein
MMLADGPPMAIFFLFAAIVIVVGVLAYMSSLQRRKELQAWAAQNGLDFSPDRSSDLDDQYPDFSCLRRGDSRYANNVLSGQYRQRAITGFDYHYSTGSGKNRQSHSFSAVIVGSPVPLEPLLIRPEGLFDKLAALVGANDIDFESVEFSKRFYVKAANHKWAYDVLHQRAMEFLLAQPNFAIQFDRRSIIVWRDRTYSAAEFGQAADVACGLLEMLPDYLVAQQTQRQG